MRTIEEIMANNAADLRNQAEWWLVVRELGKTWLPFLCENHPACRGKPPRAAPTAGEVHKALRPKTVVRLFEQLAEHDKTMDVVLAFTVFLTCPHDAKASETAAIGIIGILTEASNAMFRRRVAGEKIATATVLTYATMRPILSQGVTLFPCLAEGLARSYRTSRSKEHENN